MEYLERDLMEVRWQVTHRALGRQSPSCLDKLREDLYKGIYNIDPTLGPLYYSCYNHLCNSNILAVQPFQSVHFADAVPVVVNSSVVAKITAIPRDTVLSHERGCISSRRLDTICTEKTKPEF